ncbi:MAG: disulfide bond formation protein B [Cellvibrionaceae bacterium]
MPSTKNLLLLIWGGTIALIAIALYMQYFMDLIPCALCMTQRVFVIAVGVVALIAWLHIFLKQRASSADEIKDSPVASISKAGIRTYSILGMLMALIGSAFSMRHLWLQSLPEDLAPACGPSLSYLLDTVPLFEALTVLLQGDGNCAETSWSLLGITIPGWTLVAFAGLFLINAFIFYRGDRS